MQNENYRGQSSVLVYLKLSNILVDAILNLNLIESVFLESHAGIPATISRLLSFCRNKSDIFAIMTDRPFRVDKEITLPRDFNIDRYKSIEAWDSIILSYIVKQLINYPTIVTKTSSIITDHIYVSCPVNIIECSVFVS